MMNVRERMDEKGPLLVKGETPPEDKPLTGAYITDEELWSCVMCNACVRECPLNIHQAELILGMRRYRVLEEGAAPPEWNAVYTNIENNGALWKMPATDRMRWTEGLTLLHNGEEEPVEVPVMAARETTPEYLLWTGSAGAFDPRYRKVLRDFVRILAYLKIDFAVLGEEEISSGDFARRTGNEMLFVMQALQNIEIFSSYGVKKILTCDPHVYNTFRNEYPNLGEMPDVIHHTQFLEEMIRTGGLVFPEKPGAGETVTYHDPCYLGRINGEYDAPRRVLQALGYKLQEMPHHKATALCCGGGGGQMFREKKGTEDEIFAVRTREALTTGAATLVTACPYCMTMLGDGIKYEHAEERLMNKDLAELVADALAISPKS
jgi:Fe-S oxidoreductase